MYEGTKIERHTYFFSQSLIILNYPVWFEMWISFYHFDLVI